MSDFDLNKIHEAVLTLPYMIENGKRYIIDTGSPSSFGRNATITINQTEKSVQIFPRDLEQFFPHSVEALVGNDILKNYDLVISKNSRETKLSESPVDNLKRVIPIEYKRGVPVLSINIDERNLQCIFDTGAHINYIARSFVEHIEPIKELEDFHPSIGVFKTKIYQLTVKVLGNEQSIEVGVLPTSFDKALFGSNEFHFIIGCSLFSESTIVFSNKNKTLSIE